MNQPNIVREGAQLLGIYIALLLVSLLVPFFLMIGILLLPIPFIIFSSKYDWKLSLILLSIATVLTLFFATYISLPLTILVGAGGIMIGVSIHNNLSVYETWARGTIGFIAGILFAFLFSQLVLQINLVTEFTAMLDESLQTSKELMVQFGLGDQAEEQMKIVEEQMYHLTNLIPAGIAIFSIIYAFITQWMSYKVMNRSSSEQFRFPPVRNLRFPVSIVWIYFFALVFSFFEPNSNMFHLLIHNILTLTGLFMVMQGISFAFFFVHHKKQTKLLPILLVVLTIILPFFFLYLVRILGIIDIGFGLRDRLTNEKEK